MAIRVAYGPRANIQTAIKNGVIPIDSIIITEDDSNTAELMFYDSETNLKHIVAKTKFDSTNEAMEYAIANSCEGNIITVLDRSQYKAYIVQSGGILEPLNSGSLDMSSLFSRIEGLEATSHTHGNKPLLDTITGEMVQRWNAASGAGTAGNGVLGLVQGSTEANKISVNDDGSMSVNEININQIVQAVGDELILVCG